jgi:hypothetical protein
VQRLGRHCAAALDFRAAYSIGLADYFGEQIRLIKLNSHSEWTSAQGRTEILSYNQDRYFVSINS